VIPANRGVDLLYPRDYCSCAEPFGTGPGTPGEPLAEVVVGEDSQQDVRESPGIVRPDQQAAESVFHEIGDSAYPGADDGPAVGHGLQDDRRTRLWPYGGHHDHAGLLILLPQRGVPQIAKGADAGNIYRGIASDEDQARPTGRQMTECIDKDRPSLVLAVGADEEDGRGVCRSIARQVVEVEEVGHDLDRRSGDADFRDPLRNGS
jgi:hypothetical protein